MRNFRPLAIATGVAFAAALSACPSTDVVRKPFAPQRLVEAPRAPVSSAPAESDAAYVDERITPMESVAASPDMECDRKAC